MNYIKNEVVNKIKAEHLTLAHIISLAAEAFIMACKSPEAFAQVPVPEPDAPAFT